MTDSDDEEEGITFSCVSGKDGRTRLNFSDKTKPEEAKRISNAFWKILLAEPLELDDFSAETVAPLARNLLGCFLFRGDDVFKKVGVLSGGERSRVALVCMLLRPANFLILDEPTNHLDIQSQEVLQNALREYPGSYLIVSHNRSFLDPIVDKTLEFRQGHPPRMFAGNISYYLDKIEEEKGKDASTNRVQKTTTSSSSTNRKEPRKREAAERKNAMTY
mgnify:CR=1 FL=1